MKSREFHIPTTWRVRGAAARVFHVLSKPQEFVRWWPQVYLAVREVKAGDLAGRGEWRLRQDGDWAEAHYDWTVLVTQPWMVAFAPLLKLVFVANHRWAMQRGLESLRRELAQGDR